MYETCFWGDKKEYTTITNKIDYKVNEAIECREIQIIQMLATEKINYKQIKSPLNYIGGKGKIFDQITCLFPKDIAKFVDLFVGGCNVGLNIKSNKLYCNDNLTFLIEMYQVFQLKHSNDIISYIENQIKEFELSLTNEEGYKRLRKYYNQEKNPLDLFVLIAFSFNHQIRFNNSSNLIIPLGVIEAVLMLIWKII